MEINPRGIDTVTNVLKIMLYAGLGVSVVSAGLSVATLVNGEAPLSFDTQSVFEGISGLLLLATFIVFGRWLWVASRNLWDQDVDGLAYSPASGIWWHAVPIANLFKPYEAVRQIWNGSLGSSGEYLNEGNSTLRGWWAFWLLSNLVGNIAFRLDVAPPSLLLASAVVDIGLNWFALRVVTTIGTAQARGLDRLATTFA